MSFSEANQSSSIQQESRQLATFQEESSQSFGFNQSQTMKTSSMKSSSTMKQSSSSFLQAIAFPFDGYLAPSNIITPYFSLTT